MFLRIFLVFLLVFVAYVANAFANPIPLPSCHPEFNSGSKKIPKPFSITLGERAWNDIGNDGQSDSCGARPLYGVSYSFEQAGWYGLDPREAYTKLLDEVDFDWVRLPFFWNLMVDEGGDLNLDDLEFAIEEADKRDVDVIIALGAKTPYYPEFKWPQQIRNQVKFGETINGDHPVADDILEINRRVVERLAKYDNIIYWQVENEPFLANIDNIKFDKSFLAREVEVVRSADSLARSIILNHVGPATFDKRYLALLDLLKLGDVLAVNAYFKTQGVELFSFKVFTDQLHVPWPKWFVFPAKSWFFLSPDYEKLKHEIEGKGINFWILEVQAEPYIRQVADAGTKGHFYKPDDVVAAVGYLRSTGVKSIGLWGAHFWQYREEMGDESWMKAVKKIVSQ